MFIWLESFSQIDKCELCCIPQFVAKVSVRFNSLNVQIDVPSLDSVRKQAISKCISAALGNTIGEVSLLTLDSTVNLCTKMYIVSKLSTKKETTTNLLR